MKQAILDYCYTKYDDIYSSTIDRLTSEKSGKSKKGVTEKITKSIEKQAQMEAIKTTIEEGMTLYSDNIPELWSCIYKVHLHRKSGMDDIAMVEKAVIAEQSWRASSGHAFEQMIKELGTAALSKANTDIRFILQKDLNILLKKEKLANQPTEIAWLKQQVKSSVFDIYVIAYIDVLDDDTEEKVNKPVCFGCVQCKTSIRDRVSRDIVPSKEAMKSKFWSIGFVLDGTMFSVPKYQNMVNGNPESEFKRNGWHGMYVLSAKSNNDRIYSVDTDFSIVREHTVKAFTAWHKDRMGFEIGWRADK